MTLHEFNQLSFRTQRTRAYVRGRFLAMRQQGDEAVRLFLMPEGFFVELTYSKDNRGAYLVFAFESGKDDRLADYALGVQLPDWVPAAKK